MSETDVLLVDDDPQVLDAYRETLELEGLSVTAVSAARAGLVTLGVNSATVIVCDVRMPGIDGFGMLGLVRDIDPELPIVLFSGHGDVPMAIQALRAGAWDFLQKPADPVHLVETVRRALLHRRTTLENRRLRLAASGTDDWETRILGQSAAAQKLRRVLMRLADVDTDILLLGETGTGKEVAARALHDLGKRRRGQFVAVNCGAIPETMLESELFGHEAGAFTGATSKRIGKIEYANGGTLFLDEIESMPLGAQVRLLRVLQERVLERLGSNQPVKLDVRVVTAAKERLTDLAAAGRFREDLAYRLDIARVDLPPLRDRVGDAPLLFLYFLESAAKRHGLPRAEVPATVLAALSLRPWHGNVRELRNAAERFALGIDDLDEEGTGDLGSGDETLEEQLDRCERAILQQALARNSGKVGVTATALGISRKTLYLKMGKHGLGGGDD
ncbi:MAG: sigma-54-dependent transcriptional regulator [Pannonibacter sp.]|jgi:two-component system C4-dicarboxylate transport response regulator DctD